MSSFQWVWRYSCLKLTRTEQIFVCVDGRKAVYKEKVNTRDELVARIMSSAALIKQERQHDLKRATRTICQEGWKVHWNRWWDFLNTYFELLQFIEINYITNKCNQYVICLSLKPLVRLSMPNFQTAVSPHPLKIGQMFIWTYLLRIVHTTTY